MIDQSHDIIGWLNEYSEVGELKKAMSSYSVSK